MRRLAIVASHPIQYQAPLFARLAQRIDLTVYFAHRASPADQARAGFGRGFEWDLDLLGGYRHHFLDNQASDPGVHHFRGCDTPDLRAHLARGGYDAVLVLGWHLKSYLQALLYARRLGLPVMVRGDSQLLTPRSSAKRLGKSLLYPLFLRQYAAALYVGQRSREYWEHFHYPRHRLFHSPHCIDTDWFARRSGPEVRQAFRARLGLREQDRAILFAGKLLESKRPLDALRAAARIDWPGGCVSLVVAGSGPLETELTRVAAAEKIPLIQLGFCNQSEMPAVYAAADLLVLPSDGRETWGLVANEALACGTPILLSDAVGAAPDLAADGQAGATYPVGDVEALASAATRLLRAPPSPRALRAKSEAHSVAAAAQGILNALESQRKTSGRPSKREGR